MTSDFDLIVIGGASAGLAGALQVARLGFSVLVLDAGQPRNRYAGHMHGYLGRDHTSPLQLVEDGKNELKSYGVELRTATVRETSTAADGFEVVTDEGQRFRARRLLLATGARDRLPVIGDVYSYWGRGVHHCPFCDGWEYRGRRIGVLVDVPEAIHQVKMLARLAAQLVVFTAGAPADLVAELQAGGFDVRHDEIVKVIGSERLTAVGLSDGTELALDALFLRPDAEPNDGPVAALGLDRTSFFGAEWVAVDQFGQTSHPGVFAAGNIVNPMFSVAVSTAGGAQAGYAIVGSLL